MVSVRRELTTYPLKGDKKAKYASAHDLRRSCATRLVDAGVPEREVAVIMRHASVETTRRHYVPTNVQRSANIIREKLGVPKISGYTSEGESWKITKNTVF
jgi:integrase